LQGIWPSRNVEETPFERVDELDLRVALAELAASGLVDEQFRTDGGQRVLSPSIREQTSAWLRAKAGGQSLVIDPPNGRLPASTPEGAARESTAWRSSWGSGPWDGPEDLGPYDRCISRGVLGSMFPSIDSSGIEIVQAPGVVAIRNEMVHEARIIPLDNRPHLPSAIRSYMGDARGRWDGATLVIETTNFNGRTGARVNGDQNPTSVQLRVVERLTRTDVETIEYQVTIDDPGTWVRPWTVGFPLKRDPLYVWSEYACHEGNYGLRNVLSAARARERRQP